MKKGAICLIIPPSVFLLDERVFITLGILRIAAVLEKEYCVDVLDLSGVQNFEAVIGDYVSSTNATIFGITATTPQMPAVKRIVTALRKGEAKIILGGPHGTLVHAAYRRERLAGKTGRATESMQQLSALVDVVVAGDGEHAIFEALKPGALKIIDADDPKSSLFLTEKDLESLPLPARHLIDMDSYHYFIDGERATSIIAQLGCPFECGFCGGRYSPSLRRARVRSIESVISEIEFLYRKYGIKGFMFYDDELNVNGKLMVTMMHALADLQERLGVRFAFRGFVKSQLFTDEQAAAMVRAGFKWILVGFESGSPRILRNINKKATVEDNTRCMEIAGRHGLKVKALMSVGHPGESEETIMETRDWLLAAHPDDFDVTLITVYPGTPYYDDAIPDEADPHIWRYTYHGDVLSSKTIDYTEVSDYYKGDPNGGYVSFVFTDFLTGEQIVALRDLVERDVRTKLNIPFNPGVSPAARYEHSMGQSGPLPPFILKC